VLSVDDFLETFCSDRSRTIGKYKEAARTDFHKPFLDIVQWANEAGATSVIVGGSFVSKKERPSDMDVVILFAKAELIPKSNEQFDVNGVILDVQLLAEDQPTLVAAYLELLATTRSNVPHGLVQIKFHPSFETLVRPEQSSPDFDIVKVTYLGRRWSQQQAPKGLVIPIHGIRTNAEDWLPHLCLSASTSGWAVAPYVYGYREALILASEEQKAAVVEGFRDWLIQVRRQYEGPISVIAHSFGTYVVGRYLTEAADITEKFDAVILCGSILNSTFDWKMLLDDAVVGRILNTVSGRDEWVKFMPDGGLRLLAHDKLYGDAGYAGFSQEHPRLHQIRSSLLKHNNVFKSDVVLGEWLPFLEMSKGSQLRRSYEKALEAVNATIN
jgi:pimeloyl-ACP methyl ester carboxylesterase